MAFKFDKDKKIKPFVSKAERNRSENNENKGLTAGKIAGRILLSVLTVIICIFITALTALNILVNGPCEPLRDRLVLSAMQASATKWLPGLFMPQEKVDEIVAQSFVVNTDVISLE